MIVQLFVLQLCQNCGEAMFIDVTVFTTILRLADYRQSSVAPDSISGSRPTLSLNEVLFPFQNAGQSPSCVDFALPPIYNSQSLLRVSEPLRVHFDVILLCSYPQHQIKKGLQYTKTKWKFKLDSLTSYLRQGLIRYGCAYPISREKVYRYRCFFFIWKYPTISAVKSCGLVCVFQKVLPTYT